MIDLLIKARYATFAAVALLLIALLLWGKSVTYEQSLTSFFPSGDPHVVEYQRASDTFGNDNLIFVVYDDPELLTARGMDRLAELAASVGPERIAAVTSVQSLDATPAFWTIDDRLIALGRIPKLLRSGAVRALRGLAGSVDLSIGKALRSAKESELPELRDRIANHPLLQGTLVSANGKSTAAVVRLKGMGEQDPKATVTSLRAAADSFARKHRLSRPALVGPPVLLADGFSAIEVDGRRLAAVGMALIGLVTLSATWSLWWAIVPILAGWVVWLATETILARLGLKLSLSGGPLVAQIVVLTMPAASHLAIHFRDSLRRDHDRPGAARETLAAVVAPVLWCAITGAIGYGALFTSNVVPVFQFGAILAICTLLAAVLTMLLSPIAMLPPFPLEIPVRAGSRSRVSTRLNQLTEWVARHPAIIVFGTLLVVLPLLSGLGRLSVESNYINAFKPSTRIVPDYRSAEERLGGIGLVSLVVPQAAELNMAALGRIRELENRILNSQAQTDAPIARMMSLATVLDPDKRLAARPASEADELLALKLDLIRSSPQSDLLRNFWNADAGGGWSRILMRVSERQEAIAKEQTFDRAVALARESTFGPTSYLTGMSYLLTQTTRSVVRTSWTTFVYSAVTILIMLTLAFRGPVLAALALIPTLLAVGFVLGLSGWLRIRLDIATALVASVALGLSVDDTFHCLLQFRRHRRAKDSFHESLLDSYAVTGPGVLLSSLAVAIGFLVLRFSEFVPFSNFGAMVGIATLGSSLGNLVLLPACLAFGEGIKQRALVRAQSRDPQVQARGEA